MLKLKDVLKEIKEAIVAVHVYIFQRISSITRRFIAFIKLTVKKLFDSIVALLRHLKTALRQILKVIKLPLYYLLVGPIRILRAMEALGEKIK